MLIDFSVENFRSFKETATLSLERVGRLREEQHDENNIFATKRPRHELLKSAVIYGANASGKSNLLLAMRFAVSFVRESVQGIQPGAKLLVFPFKFSNETQKKPSSFEFRFHLSGSDYRYGFEVSNEKVEAEWLYRGERMLFERDGSSIEISAKFPGGKDLISKTRDNALFLSACAQFNEPISTKVINDFFNRFDVISGVQDVAYRNFVLEWIEQPDHLMCMVDLLKMAGSDIHDIKVREVDIPQQVREFLPPQLQNAPDKAKQITTSHHVGDESYELDFQMESEGTRKLFHMAGPLFNTLANGSILVIDELDARLHPLLVKRLVEMFHCDNNNNAQLIFATHDTNLLSNQLFRRDQIWFTEKNFEEATELYSLAEYKMDDGKKVRQDASYEKEYIRGRYGAIPFLGDFCFGGGE